MSYRASHDRTIRRFSRSMPYGLCRMSTYPEASVTMSEKRLKNKVVRTRLSESEFNVCLVKAQDCGMKLSAFSRNCMLARKTIAKTDAHIINELRRQGGLLIKLSGEIKALNTSDQRMNELTNEMKNLYREIHKTIHSIIGRTSNDCENTFEA